MKETSRRGDDYERSTHRERAQRESSAEIETLDLTGCTDKEEEQKRLELEMIKRRDRIERWRAERKRKELESKKVTITPITTVKKWSLENESDDDDDVKEVPIKETITNDVAAPDPIKLPSQHFGKDFQLIVNCTLKFNLQLMPKIITLFNFE